jgi:hypothetical protein
MISIPDAMVVAVAIATLWILAVDPLLTCGTRKPANLAAWERGALATAGTIRAIAARPELIQAFRDDPEDALLALASGIEQGTTNHDSRG